MADEFYIPGIPQNLQGVLYTPTHNQATVKQLRALNAGNPAAQQELVKDDRYWQGREMARDNPLAALASYLGGVPYDAAKVAYFNGPKPVQRGLEQLTEKLFPGEAFNQQTTSRPSVAAGGAQLHGIAEGTFQNLRDKLEALNRKTFPEPVVNAVRAFTESANTTPTLANRLLGDNMPDIDTKGMTEAQRGEFLRGSLARWGLKNAVANGLDFTGTWKKAASTLLQTINGDFDTRPATPNWAEPDTLFLRAAAPGIKPVEKMTPEQSKAHMAKVNAVLASWK